MDNNAKSELGPTALHAVRFPGESSNYRAARNDLLSAEMALRKQIEEVAAMRRELPLGGAVPEDYEFAEGGADLEDVRSKRRVKLSALFERQNASLVIYSFMYGPGMAKACPMCTSFLDSLNATAPHATQRINLAVVAKSPIERIRAFARERGWRNLRMLSSADNSFNRDYYGETGEGAQIPAINVFVRRKGKIHHSYGAELLYIAAEPGQNGRQADLIWPLWNLFDLTVEGRGMDWYPKLSYGQ
jgi:predicted dithiol-disulfide oxidoreductase (DUF899 family)